MHRFCACVLVLAGCAASSGRRSGATPLGGASARGDACDRSGKRLVELDLDRDKRPDVYRLFAKRQENGRFVEYLSCKEVDLNHDGRKDLWLHYGPDGARTVEEMDLDFDGRIDLVTFWAGGKMQRQELDTDFDGRTDVTRHFQNDKLIRVERDSNRDGNIDYREFYEGGVLDRIGYDENGDGRVDRWERVPPPAGAPTPEPPPPAKPAEPPAKGK